LDAVDASSGGSSLSRIAEGSGSSTDFPTTPGAFVNGGCHDAFVARIADHVPLQVFRRGIGHGTTVKLTATPAFGSVFTGWYGCDFVDGQHGWVTMSKARLVTARFFGIPLW